MIKSIKENTNATKKKNIDKSLLDEIENNYLTFLEEVKNYSAQKTDVRKLAKQLRLKFEKIKELENLQFTYKTKSVKKAAKIMNVFIEQKDISLEILTSYLLVHELGKVVCEENFEDLSRSWIDEWLLSKIMNSIYQEIGFDEHDRWQAQTMVKILTSFATWFHRFTDKESPNYQFINSLFKDPLVQKYLQVNRHQDILWFNKEAVQFPAGEYKGAGKYFKVFFHMR